MVPSCSLPRDVLKGLLKTPTETVQLQGLLDDIAPDLLRPLNDYKRPPHVCVHHGRMVYAGESFNPPLSYSAYDTPSTIFSQFPAFAAFSPRREAHAAMGAHSYPGDGVPSSGSAPELPYGRPIQWVSAPSVSTAPSDSPSSTLIDTQLSENPPTSGHNKFIQWRFEPHDEPSMATPHIYPTPIEPSWRPSPKCRSPILRYQSPVQTDSDVECEITSAQPQATRMDDWASYSPPSINTSSTAADLSEIFDKESMIGGPMYTF